MKVGIFLDTTAPGIGGAEGTAAMIANHMREMARVEILHHRDTALTISDLESRFGVDLGGVDVRQCDLKMRHWHVYNPFRRYRIAREIDAELSRDYDLFVCITHCYVPISAARTGFLIVLFPLTDKREKSETYKGLGGRLADAYLRWEWGKRMKSYRVKTANSAFTKEWTQRRWGIDCQVLYPPVDVDSTHLPKEKIIVSVGRFSVPKRQLEMAETFARLQHELPEWSYVSAGGMGGSPQEQVYVDSVRRAANGSRLQVLINESHRGLRQLYARCSVFWHAAGYGDNLERSPERAEHFGMTTVEAMAAGAVPVVFDQGGQREIVQHGVSGFLWRSLDELRECTSFLAGNAKLRVRMSQAARERAREFSRERMLERFATLAGLSKK